MHLEIIEVYFDDHLFDLVVRKYILDVRTCDKLFIVWLYKLKGRFLYHQSPPSNIN